MGVYMIAFLIIFLVASGTASATKPEPVPTVKAIPAETLAMGKAKGVATRKAGVLRIAYEGKAVARFTNIRPTECAGDNTCSVWTFDRLIRVFDRPTGTVKTLALLVWFNGENPEQFVFVHWDGTLLFIDSDPVISAKREWLSFGGDPDQDGYFTVIDLTAPFGSGVYRTSLHCVPQRFSSETTLMVACPSYDYDTRTGKKFKARVDRIGDEWRLTALNVKFKKDEESPKRISAKDAEPYYSLKSEPEIGYQKLTKQGN